jgi:hypothetical protein
LNLFDLKRESWDKDPSSAILRQAQDLATEDKAGDRFAHQSIAKVGRPAEKEMGRGREGGRMGGREWEKRGMGEKWCPVLVPRYPLRS